MVDTTRKGVAQYLSIAEVRRTDANVNYLVADGASPILVRFTDLIAGRNIIGVQTAGPVTVQLPLEATEEQVITVSDERGTADVDPITVEIVSSLHPKSPTKEQSDTENRALTAGDHHMMLSYSSPSLYE